MQTGERERERRTAGARTTEEAVRWLARLERGRTFLTGPYARTGRFEGCGYDGRGGVWITGDDRTFGTAAGIDEAVAEVIAELVLERDGNEGEGTQPGIRVRCRIRTEPEAERTTEAAELWFEAPVREGRAERAEPAYREPGNGAGVRGTAATAEDRKAAGAAVQRAMNRRLSGMTLQEA